MGRPKRPLGRAKHRLTERVRALLHLVHAGDLAQASRVTGIPYPTLRDLYVGRTVNPGVATLERLAATYRISWDWFHSEAEPEEEPALGVAAFLPPAPGDGRTRAQFREILIPFAAWPLYQLSVELGRRLGRLPPKAGRPIVGEASGEAFRFRLSTFLFQPLLAAERAGEPVILEATELERHLAGARGRAWVARLTALGRMWRAALPGLLG